MLELAVYVVGFITLSGLMAAVEAAVLNVSRGEIEELRLNHAWGADALRAITSRMTQPVIVMVIFTNTINVLGPILAGHKAIELYGNVAIGAITTVLTLGSILFSEIIPKSLGSHYAPLISRCVAPVIQVLIVSLYPLVVALDWFSGLLKSGKRRIGTEAQIRSLTLIGRREGYIESDEGTMVHRAFLLNDRLAADIMTPLNAAVWVQKTTKVGDAATHVFRHAYSRYPVFGESPDDVGAVHEGVDIHTGCSGSGAVNAVGHSYCLDLVLIVDVQVQIIDTIFGVDCNYRMTRCRGRANGIVLSRSVSVGTDDSVVVVTFTITVAFTVVRVGIVAPVFEDRVGFTNFSEGLVCAVGETICIGFTGHSDCLTVGFDCTRVIDLGFAVVGVLDLLDHATCSSPCPSMV